MLSSLSRVPARCSISASWCSQNSYLFLGSSKLYE
jgi:hypothetical protein